jgi:hypothetical protein
MSSATPPQPSQPNRRSARRLQPRSNVRIECRKGTLGLGPNLAQGAVDISQTGVCLLLTEALDRGQEVEILIPDTGCGHPLKRTGRAVWSQPAAGGRYQTRLRFDAGLSYLEVQALARPLQTLR